MRQTKTSGWIVASSSKAAMRALRFVVVPLGVSLVMTASTARAGDADDRTFSEKPVSYTHLTLPTIYSV